MTDRVITLLRQEGCRGDERIGQLLLKEPDIGQAMKLLSLLIDRSNTVPTDLMEEEEEEEGEQRIERDGDGFERGKANRHQSIKRNQSAKHSKHANQINTTNARSNENSVSTTLEGILCIYILMSYSFVDSVEHTTSDQPRHAKPKVVIIDKERPIVDTNLFSACIHKTTLSEPTFLYLVQYMEDNQIEITEDFLINSFSALAHNSRNINSLLDIIYSFCTEENSTQLRGSHWRQFIRQLVHEDRCESVISDNLELQKKGVIQTNRESLLLTLFQTLASSEGVSTSQTNSSLSFSDIEGQINSCNHERFQSDLRVVKDVRIVHWFLNIVNGSLS